MLSPLSNWLSLACEMCSETYSVDVARVNKGECPTCRIPIRPIVHLIIDAATEWELERTEMRTRSAKPETIQ